MVVLHAILHFVHVCKLDDAMFHVYKTTLLISDILSCNVCRFFWIISFITAMGFSAYFISNIYDKWNVTPVIVGINPKFKTIQSIPFPAITMCNMNQVRKSVAMEIIKNQ